MYYKLNNTIIKNTDMEPYEDINDKIKKRKIPPYESIDEKLKTVKKAKVQPERKIKVQPERNRPNTIHGNQKSKLTNEQENLLKSSSYELKETESKESISHADSQKNDISKNKFKPKDIIVESSKTVTRKLFFSMPESDGSFIIDNGEPSNDGRKYFRIDYIDGSEKGELHYITGDRDKRAINRLESYLKPVCDIDNIINADSATKVEFYYPGTVSLRNDSWVIDPDNKAKIKLL